MDTLQIFLRFLFVAFFLLAVENFFNKSCSVILLSCKFYFVLVNTIFQKKNKQLIYSLKKLKNSMCCQIKNDKGNCSKFLEGMGVGYDLQLSQCNFLRYIECENTEAYISLMLIVENLLVCNCLLLLLYSFFQELNPYCYIKNSNMKT